MSRLWSGSWEASQKG